ncbi:transposase [Sutcliffiella horikoshii]|uniref:Transposase n=1 Tax=Sutcliffiella horikoshii TaxID=79883 RepID=A0AA95B560_9BACI|nr:Mu transposase C-terminal domain-containing protein [Sutcliffiella horikoshii]TYS57318.1 transposase [Sutcliffiella horikoshii]
MLIVENSIIELLNFENETEQPILLRVLWISPDGIDIIVVNITDKKKMKFPYSLKFTQILSEILENRARVLEIEPDTRLISPDENYLKKYGAQRDSNWLIIQNIANEEPDIYLPKLRGKLIHKTVEETGKSKKELYRLLKRYWFYGKTKNALLRNYFDCGAPGEPRNFTKKPGPKSADGNDYIVKDYDKQIFKKAIKKFHIERKMDLTATHQHMCEEHYNAGYYRKNGVMVPIIEPQKVPTLRQFSYWYHNEYTLGKQYANRHGRRKSEMDVRPLQGDATERAKGVGFLYEIDSTPADIILVANDRKTTIGTPTLYIVKDVYSRMVVGFHASLLHASKIEQMVALENSASDKVEFCRQYGIKIEESDWPCKYLPKFLVGDRGELKGKWTENLVNINIDVANAPSYRGDLKPFVEQHFRLTNKKIREQLSHAGAKPAKLRERGEFDPTRNAALTIYEFTQFMILQIIAFNKSALNKEYFVTKEMFEEEVELTPLAVWNWGKRKNLLHEVRRDLLRYNLLPKESVPVTRHGIKFSNMYYTCEIAIKEGWFEEKCIEGQDTITICYDPRNVSSIFIRLKNGRIEKCYLTAKYKDYDGLHLEEVKEILKYKRNQIKIKEREEKQHLAEFHAFSENLADEAIATTKEATSNFSFYERQKNKREKKKQEGKSIGSQNAWTAINHTNTDRKNNISEGVIEFPNGKEVVKADETSKIQQIFTKKNKARRRSNESLE